MSVARALVTTDSDRWSTPPDLLREIRMFLGDFHDPCPLRRPGEPITSGLWERWTGQVYVNPPYGRIIGTWVGKALTDPVDELLLLIPARTDTAWFQPCFAHPICFIRGRLRFSGSKENAPFPSCLVYRGSRIAAFRAAFQHRGAIISPGRLP